MWYHILLIQPEFFLQVWSGISIDPRTIVGIISPNDMEAYRLKVVFELDIYTGPRNSDSVLRS